MFRSLFPEGFEPQLATVWRTGMRGEIAVAREAAHAILAQAWDARDELLEACAAIQIAWFCFQSGENETGLEHATLAKRLFQSLGSACGEAAAGALLAWLLLEVGLSEDASQEAVQAFDRLDAASDPAILGFGTNVLGCVFLSCQQFEQSIQLCTEAIMLAERSGDPVRTGWWRVNLAGAQAQVGHRALAQDRPADAVPALAKAVAINRQAFEAAEVTGDLWCQHLTLCNAAEYLCAAGHVEEAAAQLDRCDALPPIDVPRSRIHYLFTRAEVLLRAGRPAEALPSCREALLRAGETGDIEAKILSLKHMSAIHEQLGAFKDALACFKQFFAAHQMLAADKAQRLARLAGIRYDTQKLRQQAEAAEAQVASLVRTVHSDPLTGLANRRAFDQAIAGLAEPGRPYSLAIVDLDRFKRINDRFSHLVGDEVLKHVGAVLRGCCRPGDLATRLGGEEFALVIDGLEGAAAASHCETVRQALADVDWNRFHTDLRVTASIGLACGSEASGPGGVLALADQRLYQAKKQGRNRVVAGAARRRAAAVRASS